MAETHQAPAVQAPEASEPPVPPESVLPPLGALMAQLAEARWSPILGAGRLEFNGSASELSGSAQRATGVLYAGETAGGWVRAALDFGGGAGTRAQDNKALAAWLQGVGEGLAQLLATPMEVRLVQAGDRPEAGPGVPDGAVLEFSGTFGRRAGTAWLWMEPSLMARCLDALAQEGEGEADPGADGEDPQARGSARSMPDAVERAVDDDPVEEFRRPAPFPPLPESGPEADVGRIDVLLDVPLQVTVELGRTERQIREILSLVPGGVLELDRLAGDPLDVLINGKRIARAEVVVVDERFAIRITEILAPEERIAPTD